MCAKRIGLNITFCNWIQTILSSAFLSVSVNDASHGYFNYTRKARQGDPLHPLLFCLAEEVLSRSISKLVEEWDLKLIKSIKDIHIPSHVLYANDILIFCKGSLANIQVLMNLFSRYSTASGHNINNPKSFIYSGSISQSRLLHIATLTSFSRDSLPFMYLGASISRNI